MKAGLKARLMLSYGLVSFVLVICFLLLFNVMLGHHFQAYVKQKQERVNQELVRLVQNELERPDGADFEFLKHIGEDALNNGVVLMVFDRNGISLYCGDCDDMEKCSMMIRSLTQRMELQYPNWNQEYRETRYELTSQEGELVGTVLLGSYGSFFFSEEDIFFINRVNGLMYVVAGVFLLVAFVMSAWIAGHIAKPLRFVTKHTKAMEQNQYTKRIELESNIKELDGLIASVNALADTLERQQQIKKRMAADYAHEFRTPLTSLQLNLEAMIDGIFEITPDRLESCRVEILRLSRMTGEIDKIVELENNHLFLTKESFDLGELLAQGGAALESEFHEKEIELILDCPYVEMVGDRDKVYQVIMNLLSNAMKYTKSTGSVRASTYERNHRVILEVCDNGEGISKEDLPYIFEHLYRSDDSRARATGGSGIGLAVVRSIVIAHGGKVEVESQLGQGSCFRVIF